MASPFGMMGFGLNLGRSHSKIVIVALAVCLLHGGDDGGPRWVITNIAP